MGRRPCATASSIAARASAAQRAAEQTVDGLGLAALASPQLLQRDALLGAQYELSRKIAQFTAAFNEALDQAVARAAGVPVVPVALDYSRKTVSIWPAMGLTDDVEADLARIQQRYRAEMARHPAHYGQ